VKTFDRFIIDGNELAIKKSDIINEETMPKSDVNMSGKNTLIHSMRCFFESLYNIFFRDTTITIDSSQSLSLVD